MRDQNDQWKQEQDEQEQFENEYYTLVPFDKEFSMFVKSHEEEKKMDFCSYNKIYEDGYGATWKTDCGNSRGYSSPTEVGFSSSPLPTEVGKFCQFCGKKIILNKVGAK